MYTQIRRRREVDTDIQTVRSRRRDAATKIQTHIYNFDAKMQIQRRDADSEKKIQYANTNTSIRSYKDADEKADAKIPKRRYKYADAET